MIMPTAWCSAKGTDMTEGTSHIIVKQSHVQGAPKESSIQASIDGHVLSVVFTEDLGQVAIDISTAAGATVDYNSIHTPNGVNFYIPNSGSYVVTFTLPNNDVYYGEFEDSRPGIHLH